MEYNSIILDHFDNPRNVGLLPKALEVGTGYIKFDQPNEVLRIQLKINQVTQKVEDSKFKAHGCVGLIGVSSYVTELIKGMSIDSILLLNFGDYSNIFNIPTIRFYCVEMVSMTLYEAINDYRNKNRPLYIHLRNS